MLNKIILMGNIGRAPEYAKTQAGKETARFFLATSTSWKAKDGEWHTHTDWHRVSVFKESTVRWMKDVLKQGTTVYIEGKLSYHCWTDKYGQARATPHIMITNRDGKLEFIRSPQDRILKIDSNHQNTSQDVEAPPDLEELAPTYNQQEKTNE